MRPAGRDGSSVAADTPAAAPPVIPARSNLELRDRLDRVKMRIRSLVPPPRGSHAWLRRHGLLVVGRHSYGQPGVRWFEGDSFRVTIGRWCSIASDVEIMPGGNHRTDTVTTFPIRRRFGLPGFEEAGQPWTKGDVEIGSDVWIGRGAKILGGVTIGHGAVVAAWSIVTKDVPPYTFVAGTPAREQRRRFPEEIVESLLRIAWWEWPDELVLERVDELTSTDLVAFTRRYDPALGAAPTTSGSTAAASHAEGALRPTRRGGMA